MLLLAAFKDLEPVWQLVVISNQKTASIFVFLVAQTNAVEEDEKSGFGDEMNM